MPVTEVATITLVAGSDLSDVESNASKVWQGMCDTVSRQDGCQGVFYGQEHENPAVGQLFVNWDKLSSHESFIASPDYGPMLEHLKPIMAGPPELVHFEFNTAGNATAALSAPITELATFYLLPDERESWEAKMAPFGQNVAKYAQGFTGLTWGWSVEDVEHEGFGAGNRGKACLIAIGWQSKDAHMAFRETEEFKDSIGPLREGPKGVEMHHTAILKV